MKTSFKTCLVLVLLALLSASALAQSTPEDFITTWETTSANESITIPTYPHATYDYAVNWGDGATTTGHTGDASHTYAAAGTYTVTISGTFPGIFINSGPYPGTFINMNDGPAKTQIRSVTQWGSQAWTSMSGAFRGVTDFEITASDTPNLASGPIMESMFEDATGFTGANSRIGEWDIGNVTNMSSMFVRISAFNQDIGDWDVGNVTDMESMFFAAIAFNQDIGDWDVGNVTNMSSMFSTTTAFNQDIGGWDVGNVTNMSSMFSNTTAFNQDIGGWDVGNVTNMSFMFTDTTAFNQDIGEWNVGNVTNLRGMFFGASVFNQDIGDWDVGNVTDISGMFVRISAFNQDIGAWDVGNVTDMSSVFYGASAFNQDIGDWDVSDVTDMWSMFGATDAFNQDIGAWDVGNVTDMSSVFYGASAFNQDIGDWDVSNVTDMWSMFGATDAFNQDIGAWDVSNVTDMRNMFYKASAFNQDIGGWDISSVTDMRRMFRASGIDTPNYDSILNGWSTLDPGETHIPTGITLGASGLKLSSAGQAAYELLTAPVIEGGYGWTIIDISLSSLALSDGTLSPALAGNVTEYSAGTVANTVTSLTITPTVTDGTARVRVGDQHETASGIPSTVALSEGANSIAIVVTAADGVGSSLIYTLGVERAAGALPEPEPELPEGQAEVASAATDGLPTDARFGGGITIDGGESYSEGGVVNVGDAVEIRLTLIPDSRHVGMEAHIVVAIVEAVGAISLFTAEGLMPFTGSLEAFDTRMLAPVVEIDVLGGAYMVQPQDAGIEADFFVGYFLADDPDAVVYHSGEPVPLKIE